MRRSRLMSLLGVLTLLTATFAAASWGGAPAQSLTIDPTSWAPTATVGGTRAEQVFTITFSGKGNSGTLGSGVSGGGGAFAVPASLAGCDGVSLSAKNPTCQMTVRFTPTSDTTYNATLNVSSRKLTTSAALTGTGQAPAPPSLSINDAPYVHSNTSNNIVTFTVTMSRPSTTAVTFDWAATDDTAYWGSSCNGDADYTSTAQTGSRTIAVGQTTATIQFGTCQGGPAYGPPMQFKTYFTVTISNPNGATITNDTGTAEIRIS